MTQEQARAAAVENAFERIEPGMTIGLGSGRAVFALAKLIGERSAGASLTGITASPETRELAEASGILVLDLNAETVIDLAFDGADEIDAEFQMIKGGGAALLPEKLVLAAANHVVIMVEANKVVEHLGDTHTLPIEIVRFGWEATRERVLDIAGKAELRRNGEAPVVTSEGHYLLDSAVPHVPLAQLADDLKLTLGVVEHGLFLHEADDVIIGHPDGSIEVRSR